MVKEFTGTKSVPMTVMSCLTIDTTMLFSTPVAVLVLMLQDMPFYCGVEPTGVDQS